MKISLLKASDGRQFVNADVPGLRAQGVPEADIAAGAAGVLCALVDEVAERKRLAVMTPGAGQALEYRQAYDEALAALASPSTASTERFHMLAATVGLDIDPATGKPATDVLGVARCVVLAYGELVAFGAAIREARLRGKAAIRSAATVEAAQAAYSAIPWPN